MRIFDKFKKKEEHKNSGPMFLYSEKELEEVDNFIVREFGKCDDIVHESDSFDIHLDVYIIPPMDGEPFYKLITIGAGAYKMKVPYNTDDLYIERAEYVMYVSKDWNFNSDKPDDYWPIKVLKNTARLPILCGKCLTFSDTWKTDSEGTVFAPGTRFNSVILDFCEKYHEEVSFKTSTGKEITFHQVIPLFPEELMFNCNSDSVGAIFDKFEERGIEYKIVDNNRRSAID